MTDIEQAKAEWEDIRADPDTAIRREKWAVWANTTGLALLTENASLRKQLEDAREALEPHADTNIQEQTPGLELYRRITLARKALKGKS